MAGNSRWAQYAGLIDATEIAQILSADFNEGVDGRLAVPLGSVDPNASYLLGGSPSFRFTSHALDALLDVVGIGGYACTSSFQLGYRERSAGAEFEATSGKKYTAAKCFLVPEAVQLSKGAYGTISYSAFAYSADGTTQPVVTAATLVTGTPLETEKFTLGAVTIAGGAALKVSSVSLSFRIGVKLFTDPAHLYPTAVSIVSREPVAEIQLEDVGQLSDALIKGGEIATVVINAKKLSSVGAGFLGSGDKSFTMAAAFASARSTGTQGADASMSITAQARKSGATAIVVIA